MPQPAMDTFEAFVVTFQDCRDGMIVAQFASPNLEEAQMWRDRTEAALNEVAVHVIAYFTRSVDSGKVICGWSGPFRPTKPKLCASRPNLR